MTKLNAALTGLLAAAATLFSGMALAQGHPSICQAIAADQPRVIPASLVAAAAEEVKITYVGHSAFRIETPQDVVIVTDFTGFAGEGRAPDIVTMNHAHSSHYTDFPDPAIPHVLRGWNPEGSGPAKHELELRDTFVRNVATDLYYETILREKDGNSIFVFEVAGLCIGHLGHLHHKLAPEHIAQIGRIDVLFMPVDGNYTMSLAGMIELAGQLRSSMVIPMHFFSTFTLQRFMSGMADKFAIDVREGNSLTVSLATLPATPTVSVLSPY